MQPTLHDAHVLVSAPTQVVAGADGSVGGGAEGVYHYDVRAVSRLCHRVDAVVDWVGTEVSTADRLVQRYIVRGVGESTADPEIVLTRDLTIAAGEVTDRLSFANVGTEVRELEVCVDVASDLAGMDAVMTGRPVAEVAPEVELGGDDVCL